MRLRAPRKISQLFYEGGTNGCLVRQESRIKVLGDWADVSGVMPFADHPQSATIQLPSESSGGRRSVSCAVLNGDGKRLIVEAGEPLPVSTALSVEYNDAMFLGEVSACAPGGENRWELEVRIEQILTGLQSLMALRAGLLGEGAAQPVVPAPAGVRVN